MERTVSGLRMTRALALLVLLWCGAPVAAAAQGPESVADLARDLSDVVVNISTTRRLPGGGGIPFPDTPDGSPLGDLFDQLNPNQGQDERSMREARSLGSGFVISEDGLIVTNNHVIEGADEVLVYLSDGKRLEADVVGVDRKTDLAVLRVDAEEPLPYASFGDSSSADVGDWVMAIGNPFGLGGSVTLGIVSARNRDINSGPYDNFIQTDAAINRGNSGGPLFDMNGDVVGINTAIIARGGTSLGIGFAVPVNLAKPIIGQLTEFGETRRGWLGIGIQRVSADIALSLGQENAGGALVAEITEDGPSDGVLREGDLILAFDGKEVTSMRALPRIVAETAVGKTVEVRILREGEEKVVEVELGRLETNEQELAGAAGRNSSDERPSEMPEGAEPDLSRLVGFEAATLNPDLRDEYRIGDAVTGGAVITEVVSGSDAADKGLAPGLVIEEVNQRDVGDLGDIIAIVGNARETGRPAVLFKVVNPSGAQRFVAVRLE